jgi:hypothetical protein
VPSADNGQHCVAQPAHNSFAAAAAAACACSTILIEPGWVATITADHNVRMDSSSSSSSSNQQQQQDSEQQQLQQQQQPGVSAVECDPIQLSIFSHR